MALPCAPVDVAIVGGGPGGSALAIHMAKAGARVALVESRHADVSAWPHMPGERLPAVARFALDRLGVNWEDFSRPQGRARIGWEGTGEEVHPPTSTPAIMLLRNHLDAALHESIRRAGGATHYGHRFVGLAGKAGGWRLSCLGTERREATLTARFVVDATGRGAAVARGLGLPKAKRDDSAIAVVRWWDDGPTVVSPEFALEAMPDGWCYSAQLPHGAGVAGFVTMRPLYSGVAIRRWTRAFARARLPVLPPAGTARWSPLQCFPAGPSGRAELLGPGWALVGDAAATGDPIDGRGLLRAFEMAELLSRALLARPELRKNARTAYSDYVADWLTEHRAERLRNYRISGRFGRDFMRLLEAGALEVAA